MFKIGSFENEIMKSMEHQLVSRQSENKLVKAADFLLAAANIFDSADMKEEADLITEILNNLAE